MYDCPIHIEIPNPQNKSAMKETYHARNELVEIQLCNILIESDIRSDLIKEIPSAR